MTEETSVSEELSAVAEHRIPGADADELVELPQPLQQLISTSGVKLVAVPDGTWNINGYCQYQGSNRSWCISFVSRETKDRILEKGVVRFSNVSVFIGDADFKTVIVKLCEAPPEMPDTVLIGHSSHYR